MNYQVMPPLTAEEYTELKADIKARGIMVPIELDEAGNVLDDHHRLKACRELGITDYPSIVRKGLSEAEKRTHARKLNMARRQLSAVQKRTLTKEQLFETPEKSDRQIASDLGVSNPFVSKVRKEMENAGELLTVNSCIGADGKERPRQVERKKPEESGRLEPLEGPSELPANAIRFPRPTPEPEEEPKEEPAPMRDPVVINLKEAIEAKNQEEFRQIDRDFENLEIFHKIIKLSALYRITLEIIASVVAVEPDFSGTIEDIDNFLRELTRIKGELIRGRAKHGSSY